MKIKMDSLVITEYNYNDRRVERFCREIDGDPLFKHFVSNI